MLHRSSVFSAIFGACLLVGVTSCNSQNESAARQSELPTVPTIKVDRQNIVAHRDYPATIEGTINSEVRAKVSGYITEVMIDEGAEVKKGQILFRLETQSLTQDAEAAKARVKAAEVEVEKLKPLVQKEIISPMQLETAEANLATAKSNLNAIHANIGYAEIKSPVDGVLGVINYRKGALVSPSDPQPITTVSSIDKVYANFSMNEKQYLDFIQRGNDETPAQRIANVPEVNLVLANGNTYEHKGKVETISGQVNKTTGTVSFRALFDNPRQLLTNGNTGTIEVPVHYDSVLVVPEPSTFERQGQVFVFMLNENNEAVPKKIEVQTRAKGLVVVEGGIQKGDQILAKGVGKVSNGQQVKPKPIPFEEVNSFEPVFK